MTDIFHLKTRNHEGTRILKDFILISLIIAFTFSMFSKPVQTGALMPSPITNQASFEAFLNSTGKPVLSRYRGYRASYDTFLKYSMLSYGKPSDVPGNRYDTATKQYAAHGFSYDEYTVTNTFFPDDSIYTTDPRKWNNLTLGQDAAVSWMRLTSREKEHIKKAQIYYMGQSYGTMTYSSLALTEQKCVVIAVPSWKLGFALYTRHYNSRGELRYGTLHGYGIGGIAIGGTVKPSSEPSGKVFKILPGSDYIDINFQISFNISSYSGLARSSDIARGGIQFKSSNIESSGAGPWNMQKTVRYNRASYTASSMTAKSVTEKAVIWAVSAMGDLVTKEISYTFTLEEQPKPVYVPPVIPVDSGTLKMEGAISLFKNSKTLLGYSLPLNPLRFLCLEKITLRIDFKSAPLPDYVVFYPVGGSSSYAVVNKTSATTGYSQHQYTLGVLPSTISWSNVRLSPSLSCHASCYYGGVKEDVYLYGIEITGDVYDLVYLQASGVN